MPVVMPVPPVLRALAGALVAGEPTIEEVADRLSRTLGRRWRWLRPLAQRYVKAFAGHIRPREREVARFLHHDPGLKRACTKYSDELTAAAWVSEAARMQPAPAAASWNIPSIEFIGDLADWLGLDTGDLLWFADLKGMGYRMNRNHLRHYHYRALSKASGTLRLIEAPKDRLKDVQLQILHCILEKVPPHPSIHGFLKGRSIKTFIAPHVGRRVVLRMDLQDFFPTFSGARVQTFFRFLGYPETLADLLGGLCTNATPRDVWKDAALDGDRERLRDAKVLYSRPHLPQGAPTSPALANLCFYRIDCRLSGLARSAGAEYTRYADDLAFSGDPSFEKHVDSFSMHVAAILLGEGFAVNHHKTRVMRQGLRQHLAGVVVNQRANILRHDVDRLKATLTNCIRHGPASQNRDGHPQFRSHLQGRVAFVEMINPARGKRLRALFDQVQWE